VGDELYRAVTVTEQLIARRSGTIRLRPIGVVVECHGRRVSPYGGSTDADRLHETQTNGLELEARPLPTEGRPPGFDGPIGRFAVFTDARDRRSSGDLMEVEVRVEGAYAHRLDIRPESLRLASWAGVVEVAGSWDEDRSERDVVTFRAPIRRVDPGAKDLPEVGLVHFDPVAESYAWAVSDPIALPDVVTSRSAAPAPAPAVSRRADPADPPVAAATPERTAEPTRSTSPGPSPAALGARTAINAIDELGVGDGRGVLGAVPAPVWGAAAIAPPALFALALVGRGMRRESMGIRGRRTAARSARRSLGSARSVEDIATALRCLATDLTGVSAAGMTARDVRSLLEPRFPEGAASIADAMERCDAERFGSGDGSSPAELRRAADGAIGVLMREPEREDA